MNQLALWDPAVMPRRQVWIPRCEDCGRRIWSPAALRRRFGLLLGGRCHRKRARAARRLAWAVHIPVRPAGDIPGQLAITDPEASP